MWLCLARAEVLSLLQCRVAMVEHKHTIWHFRSVASSGCSDSSIRRKSLDTEHGKIWPPPRPLPCDAPLDINLYRNVTTWSKPLEQRERTTIAVAEMQRARSQVAPRSYCPLRPIPWGRCHCHLSRASRGRFMVLNYCMCRCPIRVVNVHVLA